VQFAAAAIALGTYITDAEANLARTALLELAEP
jgi:hypothetical protein